MTENAKISGIGMIGLLAFALLAASAGSLWADVLPPEPTTTWRRNQEPSNQAIVIAGACLAGAIAVAGLALSRLPLLRKWPVAVGAGAIVAAIAVAAAAAGVYQKVEKDRAAWRNWDEQVQNRRRNWQPPPEFRHPPHLEEAPRTQSPPPTLGQETTNPGSE